MNLKTCFVVLVNYICLPQLHHMELTVLISIFVLTQEVHIQVEKHDSSLGRRPDRDSS